MTIDELIAKVKDAAAKATALPWHYHEGDIVDANHDDVYLAEYDEPETTPDSIYLMLAANNAPLLAECLEIALRAMSEADAEMQWNGMGGIGVSLARSEIDAKVKESARDGGTGRT